MLAPSLPLFLKRLASICRRVGKRLFFPLADSHFSTRLGRDCAELVSLVLAVCLALFLTKVVIAHRDLDCADMPPQICDGQILLSLGRIAACCAEDWAVGLGCLLLGAVALRLAPGRGWRRLLRFLAHVGAAAAVCYALVNAQVFHVLRRFLTVSLFQLGGGFQPERSISEYVTLPIKLAVGLLPLMVLALHLILAGAFPRFWQRLTWGLCRPLVLLGLIGVLAAGGQAAQAGLFPGTGRDFAQNPHWLLVRSFFWDLHFGDLDDLPPGDDGEFRPGQPHLAHPPLVRRPRNVILIVLESAGAKYLSAYGYPLPTTPCLERLGERSLTFTNFYATANHTIASALPLLGGAWNDPRALSTVVDYPRYPVAHASTWLRNHGYRTYFLGAGGHRAWEDYRNLGPAFVAAAGWDLGRDPAHPFWQAAANPQGFLAEDYLDAAVFADARRLVRQAKDEKFCLVLWNYETHAPYFEGPGPDFEERLFPPALAGQPDKKDEFRAFLRSLWRTDALIGELYQELEEQGLAEDTLVAVTADHGEGFGQHGWFMHGASLYDEEVRVPLILINPYLAARGTRSTILGSHVDVWPTLADVCGFPCDPRWQGRSLLGVSDTEERRVYFARRGEMGLRQGKYKYVWDYQEKKDLLFDLERDPEERLNLAEDNLPFCRVLRAHVRDWANFNTGLTAERLEQAGR
jgi:arylsulfatase A-like enzyme